MSPVVLEADSGPESAIEIRAAKLGVEYSADAIFVTRSDGTITFVNAGFEHVYGYTSAEVVGSDAHFLSSWVDSATAIDEERDPSEARRHFSFAGRNRAKDGRILSIEGEAHPVLGEQGETTGLVWITRDVTEREAAERRLSEKGAALRSSEEHYQQLLTEHRLLERQFRQAQKMEALGLFVGAISHDFNNLLSVITSYTSLALASVPPSDPLHDDLAEVESAAKRAMEITGQLLRLCRRQSSHPCVANLGDTVQQMARMLKRLLGAAIALTVDVCPSPHRVCVEPGSIEQIVMNLAVNARDAMPKGGQLSIATSDVTINADLARQYGVEIGPYLLLSVSDTGVGMDESTQQHLFEALYTTKPPGKGTGLGLSTVAGIVKRAGGFIRVTTAPGAGATFQIYFPCVAAVEHDTTTLLNRAV